MHFKDLRYNKIYKSGNFYIIKTPWFEDFKHPRDAIIFFTKHWAFFTIVTEQYYYKQVNKGTRVDILADAEEVGDLDAANIGQKFAKALDKALE